MDNKLSELSKPVAWVLGTPSCKHLTTDEEYANWYVEKMSTALPLYSQEYVSAMLAELEAKDHAHRMHAARLISERGVLRERVTELEAKLATPVQPPELTGDEDLAECVFKYVAAIRAAGFTVEGDE